MPFSTVVKQQPFSTVVNKQPFSTVVMQHGQISPFCSAAQQMVVSMNFLDEIFDSIPLFRFSTLRSGVWDVSQAAVRKRGTQCLDIENKVAYLSPFVLTRPHRQPHGSLDCMRCPPELHVIMMALLQSTNTHTMLQHPSS